jgi:hypothetical protein
MNGQEKSDEVEPNTTTAEFWEYDSRLGRRWNLDPVVNEALSPYATFDNSPIAISDINGDDPDGDGPGDGDGYTTTTQTSTINGGPGTTPGSMTTTIQSPTQEDGPSNYVTSSPTNTSFDPVSFTNFGQNTQNQDASNSNQIIPPMQDPSRASIDDIAPNRLSPIPPPNLAPPYDPNEHSDWWDNEHIDGPGGPEHANLIAAKGGEGGSDNNKWHADNATYVDFTMWKLLGAIMGIGPKPDIHSTPEWWNTGSDLADVTSHMYNNNSSVSSPKLTHPKANTTSAPTTQAPSLKKVPDSVTTTIPLHPFSQHDTRVKIVRVPVTTTN